MKGLLREQFYCLAENGMEEQGEIYGRVYGEEMRGENYVIIISKAKI